MRRILALLLVLLLVATFMPLSTLAAGGTNNKTREIAVVFDNSGSMYGEPEGDRDPVEFSKAWCRAVYGMEVFASMMKPSDKMVVYPMHPCTLGKDGTETYDENNPLVITKSTASKLRNLYTPTPSGTPFGPVETAYNKLLESSAGEKWLILMTDANKLFSDAEGNSIWQGGENGLDARLNKFTGVNMLYLGIGADAIEPKNITGPDFYQSMQAKNGTEILSCLSDMCNTIFGRNKLTKVGGTVSYDLPMTELIVFVQGEGISNVKLGDLTPTSTMQMKYPEQGAGAKYADLFTTDQELQGVMVFFENLEAAPDGLSLSYTGKASDVVVFFEPDVELQLQVLDAAGKPVDPKSESLVSGTYIIDYCLVDRDGNKVTSELLANAKYKIEYTLDGKKETVEANEPGSITVDIGPNQKMEAEVEATFLKDYRLVRNTNQLGWPSGGLTFIAPPAGTLEIKLTEGQDPYNLSKLQEEKNFRVNFIYDGQPLPVDQLSSLENLEVTIEGSTMQARLEKDEQGYFVVLDYNGSALETKCGKFEIRVSSAYRNEDGELTNVAMGVAKATLKDDSRKLEMKLEVKQDYYQLSKLKEGEPIRVKLSYSGDPLTKAELDAIKLEYTAKGVSLIVEKDYEHSSFLLRFDAKNPPSSGDHKITVTATGVNEIGKEMTEKSSTEVSFGVMPMWLRILLWILGILLVILLWLWYRSQKVLPRDAEIKILAFTVDGEKIQAGGKCDMDGKRKKTGTITVASPRVGTDPLASQSVTLYVKACTPRHSAKKDPGALVTDVRLKGANYVSSWSLKNNVYKQDPENPTKHLSVKNKKPVSVEDNNIEMGSSSELIVKATTDNSDVFFKVLIILK